MINILGEIREWMEQTVSCYEFLPPVWQAEEGEATTEFVLNNGVVMTVCVWQPASDGIVKIRYSSQEENTLWEFKNPLWTSLTEDLFTYLKENNDNV